MHDTAARRLWSDPRALATPLVLLLVDRYGVPALNWMPETIHREVRIESGVELSDALTSRLMAGLFVVTQPDRFRSEWFAFDLACRMLNSAEEDREQMGEHADVPDLTWGALEATLLLSLFHEAEEFKGWGLEVKTYADTVLKHAGVTDPPKVLTAVGLVERGMVPIGEPRDPADPDVAAEESGRAALAHDVQETLRTNGTRLLEQLARLKDVFREIDGAGLYKHVKKIFPGVRSILPV